jgi:hypothetical protein
LEWRKYFFKSLNRALELKTDIFLRVVERLNLKTSDRHKKREKGKKALRKENPVLWIRIRIDLALLDPDLY